MLYVLNLRVRNVALKVSVEGIDCVGVFHKILLIEKRTRGESESL